MLEVLLKIGKKNKKIQELARQLNSSGAYSAYTLTCARPYLISLIAYLTKKPVFVVTLEEERASKLSSGINNFTQASYLPKASKDNSVHVQSQRIQALNVLTKPKAIVCSALETLKDKQPHPGQIPSSLNLGINQTLKLTNLAKKLTDLGYSRQYQVESPGQFSIRGNVCDVYPAQEDNPIRLEFFGDTIDEIRSFNYLDQRSIAKLSKITVIPCSAGNNLASTIEDYLKPNTLIIFEDRSLFGNKFESEILTSPRELGAPPAVQNQWILDLAGKQDDTSYTYTTCDLTVLSKDSLANPLNFAEIDFQAGQFENLFKFLKEKQNEGYLTVLNVKEEGKRARLKEMLSSWRLFSEDLRPNLAILPPLILITDYLLDDSFVWPEQKLVFISDKDIFVRQLQKLPPKLSSGHIKISAFEDLTKEDYVVHINHGIAHYEGLETKEIDGLSRDYLKLAYAQKDKLFVPVTEMDRVSRYIGADNKPPSISRLGSNQWTLIKKRVKKSVRKLAVNLLDLYAQRSQARGFSFSKDTPWQTQLEDDFPFAETAGQISVISEVKQDMQKPEPMDRLICGDVGYGKTEVALRAAFKAVQDGQQVMFLVPTTILAQQHFNTISSRLNPYPVIVDMLSRFKTKSEQNQIVEQFNQGKIDILVGTHRLLQKDVQPKSLGLIIVDEEQRFGVSHKEKLKTLKTDVDVVTLSATPIPRTLQMALSGIRNLSVIETPPDNRHPVITHVGPYRQEMVAEAINKELSRNGQVFYLYNEVQTIDSAAQKLKSLVGNNARIAIAHGQMKERQLEKTMLQFLQGKFNILVTTTIIESGIDIPSVNTLIVDKAEKFGLAQLYQIRGRVGRSERQAFAYLFYRRSLTENAVERLKTLADFTSLGSGYRIALRDLEIRGAGNILGAEQSGHVAAVGFDLYTHLLQNTIDELRGAKPKEKPKERDLPISAYIPHGYIAKEAIRIDFYQRLASAENKDEFDDALKEMSDRFGSLPKEVRNLRTIGLLKYRK